MSSLTKYRQNQPDKARMNAIHEKLTHISLRNLQRRSNHPSANPLEQTAPFLAKLPLELRRAIYIALIGNNVVHLWNNGYRKIEHRLCVSPEICRSRSLKNPCETEELLDCKAKGKKGYFLPLLQTCKQM